MPHCAPYMKSLADVLGVQDPLDKEMPVAEPETPRTAQEFARALLDTRQYRESFLRRVLTDELPPQVESWLLNTAYGKPVERVEMATTTKTLSLDDLTLEQIQQRAAFLHDLAIRVRGGEVLLKQEAHHNPSDGPSESVH